MAYHLYGVRNRAGVRNLGKLNRNGWHLVRGDGRILLAPSDYHAYQLGHYAVAQGLAACDRGFVDGGFGYLKQDAVESCIGLAKSMINNDTGYWLAGNFVPRYIACCGGTALGCFGNNTGTQEISLHAGVYVMIPRLCFRLPEGYRAKSACIRFKGYSDYVIEAIYVGNGTGYVNRWAKPMKDYRLNKSITGYSHTTSATAGGYDSWGTDLLIAHASCDPDELTIKNAFRSNFFAGQRRGSSPWTTTYPYDLVVRGYYSSAISSSTSLAYYLGNNTDITYNGTFCGAIGTNRFAGGGSSVNYTNAYPYCDANDGTFTHKNALTGAEWGEVFAGVSGTLFKKTGGHFYTDDVLPSAAKSDRSWLVKRGIDLTSWQLNALNRNGYIWIMYSNPCPWFNTTDIVELHGLSRQIYVEDCRLEVELEK